MFKIPKTSEAVGSFEERWETGLWIGTTFRDGMSLIGTPAGVYKVGTIRRKPDGEQWSQDMIKHIVGSPQQPEPVVGTGRITTFVKEKLVRVCSCMPSVVLRPASMGTTSRRLDRSASSTGLKISPRPNRK